VTVVGTIWACATALCHRAPHALERLCRTGVRQTPCGALDVGACDHPTRTAALHEVEIDIELARERPYRRQHLQRADARSRLDRLRRRFRARDLADDRAGIFSRRRAEFDQRSSDLDQIAFCAEQPRDRSAPR
jgi:hypothetical protein